jgi:hypothetical protein
MSSCVAGSLRLRGHVDFMPGDDARDGGRVFVPKDQFPGMKPKSLDVGGKQGAVLRETPTDYVFEFEDLPAEEGLAGDLILFDNEATGAATVVPVCVDVDQTF